MWGARPSLLRVAPCVMATWTQRCGVLSPSGLTFAARSTTSLLNVKVQLDWYVAPPAWTPSPRMMLAGAALGAALYSEELHIAECAPKKKQKGSNPNPAAAKKAGPALSSIEEALQPEKVYEVETLLASQLKSGKKEYLVRWKGYAAKHNTWEPMENLSNLVTEMASFDRDKDLANQAHLKELAEQKAAREAARAAAGSSGPSPAAPPEEDEDDAAEAALPWTKKKARCYAAYEPTAQKPGHATCIATEGIVGGCKCGKEIKIFTQSLWNHLESKHPRLWQELKGKLDAGAPLDGGIVASVGAGAQQSTLIAPKLTEARKNQCDRLCARWLIKSSRPITLPARLAHSSSNPLLRPPLPPPSTVTLSSALHACRAQERDVPFRDFIRGLTAGAWDPPNHRNIHQSILSMSAEGQLRVKEFMTDLLLDGIKPSIAGDIWSDRGCSLMGVLGYGIDKGWVMREWLLAATPFGATRHTGDAIDQITVVALKLAVPTWTTQVCAPTCTLACALACPALP